MLRRESSLIYLLPILFITLLIGIGITLTSFYIVKPGHAAIHLRLGSIIATNEKEGYYFKMPLIDSVTFFSTRIQKSTIETKALSKDLQELFVQMAVNYKIDNVAQLFREVGPKFEEVIIDPFVQESVKAVVAKFDAESLIQKRHEAKELVINELASRLGSKYLHLVDFNFIQLHFSDEFIKAVEAKQIAEQDAKRAENMTKQVNEEAKQTRSRAEAEAYSLKVKRESATAELIKLKSVEAQMKAIEKWDGRLPNVTSGAVPFLNLEKVA